nr:hypothetical protein [Bacteroidota bacterium]
MAQTTLAQNCIQCDENSNPSGNYASVMGVSTTASGEMSFAGGLNSQATGKQSFAFGTNAIAMSPFGTAIGLNVTAFGGSSVAIGTHLFTTTTSAFLIGSGYGDNENRLVNETSSSLMIGFNSTKPTLFVKGKSGIYSTGFVGIGNVIEPDAKLHIRGDNYSGNSDDASLFIESSGPFYSTLYVGDKNHFIRTMPESNFLFNGGGNNFVFESGNVGIGINEPGEALEVNGNIRQSSGHQIESEKICSRSENGLKLFNSRQQGICISNKGTVGINTANPATTLDVNGKTKTRSFQMPDPAPDGSESIEGCVLQSCDAYGNARWVPQSAIDDGDWTKNGTEILYTDRRVSIGTSGYKDYQLAVAGQIAAHGVKITLHVPASDYVFEKDYKLKPLTELEDYIHQNKHLPDIPSADEFEENGYNIGEMDDLLLKKIEELTLYTIEQDKLLMELKTQIEVLKSKIEQ